MYIKGYCVTTHLRYIASRGESANRRTGERLGDKIRESRSAFFAPANNVFTSTIAAIRSMLQMTGIAMNLLRSFVIVVS
jgi:hypothetical protein